MSAFIKLAASFSELLSLAFEPFLRSEGSLLLDARSAKLLLRRTRRRAFESACTGVPPSASHGRAPCVGAGAHCRAALSLLSEAADDYAAVLRLEPDSAAARAGHAAAEARAAELRREADGVAFDPYEVLGLTSDASYSQVRQAFRRQALALMPQFAPTD